MNLAISRFPNRIAFLTCTALLFAATAGAQKDAGASRALDSDGDGIVDLQDNCSAVANPNQRDSDGDLFGNRCDIDLNNDGIVNVVDLGLFRLRFFTADPDADFNGDGVVNVVDLGIVKQSFFSVPGPSGPAASNTTLQLTQAFPGINFNAPIDMHQAPNDSSRWYVLERDGRIVSFDNLDNASASVEVLDIIDSVDTTFEGGALGFAFHHDFGNTPYLYVSYTTEPGTSGGALISRLSRFDMVASPQGGFVAEPNSEVVILAITQPAANHNAEGIAFGPDKYLYWGIGDGGNSGDPSNNGQTTGNLFGTVVRIDVDVSAQDFENGVRYYIPQENPFSDNQTCVGGCPEIFAWGLRNPWRLSFDRETGDLWLGDVGQFTMEEIDRIDVGGNYGWRCYEGTVPFITSGCQPQGSYDAPVYAYGRTEGYSVTGGFVYRGTNIPSLVGTYLFGDYGSGSIWGLFGDQFAGQYVDSSVGLVSFGEALNGELYVINLNLDRIYRIEATP